MKESKRFLVAVAVGVVAFLLFRGFLVSPTAARGDETRGKIDDHLAKRKGYFKKAGGPIGAVRKALETEGRTLGELEGAVGPVELVLPPELEPTDDHDKLSYYQMLRSKLNERATGTDIVFSDAKSPLGMPLVVSAEQVHEFLARLAVARRFLDAASAAGVAGVVSAEHPPVRMGRPTGGRVCEELPYKVVAAVDERSLILLLQNLSRPERFLALKEIELEVRSTKSGTFEAKIELAGLRIVPAPEDADAAGRGPAAPRPPKRSPARGFRRRF